MNTIKIKTGTQKILESLSKLNYTNTCEKMFSISFADEKISISEIDLPEPITNLSENYTNEILEDMIPKLSQKNTLPLVVFYDEKPAGYLMAKWEEWPEGKVLVIDGILVATEYSGKGLAKALVEEAIKIAQQTKGCRGVHAEMDTTKYQANKLLLGMGFKFGGTKFFIYSKEEPSKYSKEAMYFYYPI